MLLKPESGHCPPSCLLKAQMRNASTALHVSEAMGLRALQGGWSAPPHVTVSRLPIREDCEHGVVRMTCKQSYLYFLFNLQTVISSLILGYCCAI